MQRNELAFDVVETLKGAAAISRPELIKRVRVNLDGRDLKLFDCILKQYYSENKITGRWYDPYHVFLSTYFATQLVKIERGVSSLIVPGIIVHDIGYGAVNLANLLSAQTRIMHMQESASMSAEELVRVGGFAANEIGIVVDMAATHDNWTIDFPIADFYLPLVDADKIFVVSFISFYKDWVGKEGENLSVEEFLDSRQRSFRGGKHSLSTGFAQQWCDKQFEARWREIGQDILRDKEVFRRYAIERIRAELEAGRG